MGTHSKKSILAAIGGNTIVMCAKSFGFIITGSSAMLAESIHSLADIINQTLLLVGAIRSEKEADSEHTTGYGRERFVWALISAVGIFFLGCGVTIYHGISHLLHPIPHQESSLWPIVILIFSLVVEGAVLFIAWRELRHSANERPFWKYIQTEADPSIVAVFMEDAAACLGVIIALISITLTSITHQTYWDAIGSILIGILLGFVAIWLIQRNKELLIGQSIPKQDIEKLQSILQEKSYLGKIDHIRTEVIGASEYDIQVEIEFNEKKLVQSLSIDLKEEYEKIKNFEDFVSFSQKLSVQSMEHVTQTIDLLEQEIRKELPSTRFIDIEPN
jgi:zinc transporter 9